MKIISIGEVLWDVIGGTEHLGGAPFNFAAHAENLGHTVFFVSAVGEDERGLRILKSMEELHLSTRYVRRVQSHPTGVVTVTLGPSGQPRFVIHRPAAYDLTTLSITQIDEIVNTRPDWLYFGTLLQMCAPAKALTLKLIEANSQARFFYDVNLRVGCYEPSLLRELISRASVAKLNEDEALLVGGILGLPCHSLQEFCRGCAAKFGLEAICVTRGPKGCALLLGNKFIETDGYKVKVEDGVGAGDAFAAAFVHGLGSGWPPQEIADFANRVGALVASRAGAIPPWTIEEARALSPQVKMPSD